MVQTAVILPILLCAACFVALLMVYCVSRMLEQSSPTRQTLQTIEMKVPLQDNIHIDIGSDSDESI